MNTPTFKVENSAQVLSCGHHDTQDNDIQHNGARYNDIQHNDTEQNAEHCYAV
jgi:hypothetical protein